MPKLLNYICIAILAIVLILIRAFEDDLFYDPYLLFFKNDFLYIDSPRREVAKLILSTTLRYLINSAVSLGIIYLVFKNKSSVKFSALVFAVAYLVFIIPYVYFVINPKQENYYLFFNVRRFLIQPLLLLLLLPALYYQRLKR